MLVIGKQSEFGSDSQPVRGQCQPHTKGWRLRFFSKGKETLLMTDNYYVCRQVQIKCAGMTDLDEIRTQIEVIAKMMSDEMQETAAIDLNAQPDSDTNPAEETRVSPPATGTGDSDTEHTSIIPREEMDEAARNLSGDTDE